LGLSSLSAPEPNMKTSASSRKATRTCSPSPRSTRKRDSPASSAGVKAENMPSSTCIPRECASAPDASTADGPREYRCKCSSCMLWSTTSENVSKLWAPSGVERRGCSVSRMSVRLLAKTVVPSSTMRRNGIRASASGAQVVSSGRSKGTRDPSGPARVTAASVARFVPLPSPKVCVRVKPVQRWAAVRHARRSSPYAGGPTSWIMPS